MRGNVVIKSTLWKTIVYKTTLKRKNANTNKAIKHNKNKKCQNVVENKV